MNIQRIIVISVAVAINCAVLAWLHFGTVPAATAASAAAAAPAATIVTLPTIHVYPSAEQWRELRKDHAPGVAPSAQADAASAAACLALPYYSFAPQCDAAVSG